MPFFPLPPPFGLGPGSECRRGGKASVAVGDPEGSLSMCAAGDIDILGAGGAGVKTGAGVKSACIGAVGLGFSSTR